MAGWHVDTFAGGENWNAPEVTAEAAADVADARLPVAWSPVTDVKVEVSSTVEVLATTRVEVGGGGGGDPASLVPDVNDDEPLSSSSPSSSGIWPSCFACTAKANNQILNKSARDLIRKYLVQRNNLVKTVKNFIRR